MEPRKQAILAALDSFVAQRSGMDPNNYGDVASYRSEQRSVTRDLHDYRALRRAVGYRDSLTDDMLLAAAAYRLTLTESRMQNTDYYGLNDAAGAVYRVKYCTGQYFPTEYRKAACGVLARALWDWTREHAMPAPIAKSGDHTYYPMVPGKLLSAGDWLRANFVREFGRGIASRYFN